MDIQSEIDGVRKWYNLIAEDFEKRYEGVEGLYWDNFERKIVNEYHFRGFFDEEVGWQSYH